MKQYHEIVDEVVAAIEDVISTNDVEGQLAKDIVQSAFAEWIAEYVLQGVELCHKRDLVLGSWLGEVHVQAFTKSCEKEKQ